MNQNKLQRVEKARIAKRSNIKNAVYWGWRNPTHHVEIDRRNCEKYTQKKKTLHRNADQSTDEESEVIFSN